MPGYATIEKPLVHWRPIGEGSLEVKKTPAGVG
jgi:hypothetical protein